MSPRTYTEDDARQSGRNAREAGRPMDSCPHYAMGDAGYLLRKAWRDGWVQYDRELLHKAVAR
jgi:hypothetical protein